MLVPVTALYAVLLGILSVVLLLAVGRNRLRTGVSLYDGGDTELAVAIRRHANFLEQVPLTLLLIAIVELNGAPQLWVHGLGATLLVCRIIHPFGLRHDEPKVPLRFYGAFGTLLVTLAAIAMATAQLLRA